MKKKGYWGINRAENFAIDWPVPDELEKRVVPEIFKAGGNLLFVIQVDVIDQRHAANDLNGMEEFNPRINTKIDSVHYLPALDKPPAPTMVGSVC